ncbi:MAG: O-antigen ligase family protein [Actinomycetota bacterium]
MLITDLIGRGLRRPAGIAAACLVGFWLLYGAVVGSLPSPGRPAEVLAFIQAEGRGLIPPVLFIAALGQPTAQSANRALDAILRVLAATAPLALLIGAATGLGFARNGLFHAFTSSHHVPGFIYGLGAAGRFVRRRPFDTRTRQIVILLMLAIVFLSGSRATLVGLLLVGAYLVFKDRNPALVLRRSIALAVCVTMLLAFSPRARNTAADFLAPDFFTKLGDAFEGEGTGSDRLTSSTANVVKRFGLFGEAVALTLRSPVLGVGPFRFNDVEREYVGTEGLVAVAIDGQREFNDFQAHNMILHVSAETGLLGVALFLWPLGVVLRQTRTRRPTDESEVGRVLARVVLLFSVGVGVATAGLLTAGLGFVAYPILGLTVRASRNENANMGD